MSKALADALHTDVVGQSAYQGTLDVCKTSRLVYMSNRELLKAAISSRAQQQKCKRRLADKPPFFCN